MLNLIACRLGGGVREALRWGRERLGQPERQRPARPLPAPREDAESREVAEKIWRSAVPLKRGDPVCRYLAGRAIDLERLAGANDEKLPVGLRFHPRLWNAEARRFFPAMVAAIQGPEGQFCAVHRTWLVEGKDGVTKAPVKEAKKTLGHYRLAGGAGCIRLWRPKWSEAASEDVLAFSEGIEDGLTVAQATIRAPEVWRVAAGVALAALMRTWVPNVISRVVLVAQNDRPGSNAAKLLDRVRERFRRQGYELWRLDPLAEVKDVNEAAMRLARR